MEPKKKSSIDVWLAAGCLIIVIYLGLHAASAYADYETLGERNLSTITYFLNSFEQRILEAPFYFTWTSYTKNVLIYGFLAWFIGTVYVFTTRRKYIMGKEFGTARWGNINDIKDLFAENIAKAEIKKANMSRFFITRRVMKRKVYKECRNEGKKLKSKLLNELKYKELGHKERHAEKIEINKKVKELVFLSRLEAWEPDRLSAGYLKSVQEFNQQHKQNMLSKEELTERLKEVKAIYKTKLHDFYHKKGKKKAIEQKYDNADAILTGTERISIYNFKLNNNTMILGGAGSGKTRGFVMPNILQAHSSFVITDPKSEILKKAGYFLKEIKGYKLRVLDLDNMQYSDGYNPFVYIYPERQGYEKRVLALIETVIVNTNQSESGGSKDPFWDNAERLFLQAIFFFTCDGFPLEERNMNTVLKLIAMLELPEDDDLHDSDLDYFAQIFEETHGSEHIGLQQYREFRSKSSGKTAKSIVISAVARLAPFRNSQVKRIFSYDSMRLDMLGEEKTAIFVVVPPTDKSFNFIAGILFTQMFQELQYCATEVHKNDGLRVPVPVRFILDEFANTCKIPNFVQIIAYARSFGIAIIPILQSLEQIKNMYKDEWGVIVDNCNSLLFLGSITHSDTLKYMSELLGKGTYDKRTTGHTKGKQGSSSWNWDVIGRDLMDMSEIRKLPKEKCLLVVGGRDPFYSDKYDYTEHPNYSYTSDKNDKYLYEHTPVEKSVDDIKVTHGEDINMQDKNTCVDVEEITMNFNQQEILTRVSNNFHSFVPVLEGDSDEENELLNLLDDIEVETAVDKIFSLSIETKEALEEAKRNEIKMNFDIPSIAAKVAEAGDNMIIVPDEQMAVIDGEDFEGVTFDDELETSILESEEDIGDFLSTLKDSLEEAV